MRSLLAIPAAIFGCLLTAQTAFAQSSEDKPLNLSDDGGAAQTAQASSGGSLIRTIVGLALVLGVIYGLHWLLKKAKKAKESKSSGTGLETIASLTLGPNRSLHLVRAGSEIVLLGAAEHAVTPIRRYSEAEARALGPAGGHHAAGRDARRSRADGGRRAEGLHGDPALEDGGQVKTDGANAVQLLLFIGGISLVPALLFTVTGFTRILIVLGFIRSGLGTPTAPPNQVLVGIAFFLTLFVMSPTLKEIKTEAYDPLQKGAITQEVALKRAEAPLREFMFNQTREKDLALFVKLGKVENVKTRGDVPTHVLIPAFIISELKTAFQIGFLIFLPFLIIDLVVSSTLMSMGMMMLPPVFISLPFKILLFVLVDGWNLVTASLVQSFHMS